MYLTITAHDVRLAEPDVFTAFHATLAPGLDPASAASVLSGVGTFADDGEHVFVQVDALRRLAAEHPGLDREQWEKDFAGMLAYAEKKGWTSPDGSAVRAHVEEARD